MRKQSLQLAILLSCVLQCAAQSEGGQEALQYQNRAASLLLSGAQEQAIDALEMAAAIYKAEENWPHYFSCLNQITTTYLNLSAFDSAKRMAKKALWESIEKVGRNNDETAKAAHQLAEVYSQASRYARAEEYHRLGLKIRNIIHGPEHPTIADSYRKLGKNHERQGAYEEARTHYEKARSLNVALYGASHPSNALSLSDLGQLAAVEARYAEAIDYYQQALNIRTKVLGEEHPKIAQSLLNLGRLYLKSEQPTQADSCIRKGADIFLSENGETSIIAAEGLLEYARLLFHQGYYFQAAPYANKAVDIFEAYRYTHHSSGEALSIYGTILWEAGQPAQAASQLEEAIKNGQNEPEAYRLLVEALVMAGKTEDAANWAKTYVSDVKSGDALLYLARVLLIQGHYTHAAEQLEEANGILEGKATEAERLLLKGKALLHQNDYRAARAAFEEAQQLASTYDDIRMKEVELESAYAWANTSTLLARQDRNKMDNLLAGYEKYLECQQLLESLLQYQLTPRANHQLERLQLSIHERAIENVYELYQQTQKDRYVATAFALMENSKMYSNLLYLRGLDAFSQRVFWPGMQSGGSDDPSDTQSKDAKAETLGKYDHSTLPEAAQIEQLQQQLIQEKQDALAYYYGSEAIYVFAFKQEEGIQLLQVGLHPGLEQQIEQFVQLCSTSPEGLSADALVSSFQQFVELGTKLSRALLPVELEKPASSSLLIMPHGELGFFPFEALCRDSESGTHFGLVNYLGQQLKTNYAYSATQYLQLKPVVAPQVWNAYFPVEKHNNSSFAKTISNKEKVSSSAISYLLPLADKWVTHTGGELFQSSSQLQKSVSDNALFLGVEGVLPGRAGVLNTIPVWLRHTLSDTQPEIGYFLIPSLESSPGEYSRWFLPLHASLKGRPALINRWQANRQSAPQVLDAFIEDNLGGTFPPIALLKARDAYLNDKSSQPLLAHPFYWAGYYVSGATASIETGGHSISAYWILLAVGLIICLAFWIIKK